MTHVWLSSAWADSGIRGVWRNRAGEARRFPENNTNLISLAFAGQFIVGAGEKLIVGERSRNGQRRAGDKTEKRALINPDSVSEYQQRRMSFFRVR